MPKVHNLGELAQSYASARQWLRGKATAQLAAQVQRLPMLQRHSLCNADAISHLQPHANAQTALNSAKFSKKYM